MSQGGIGIDKRTSKKGETAQPCKNQPCEFLGSFMMWLF